VEALREPAGIPRVAGESFGGLGASHIRSVIDEWKRLS
jgi:hypothetical protein